LNSLLLNGISLHYTGSRYNKHWISLEETTEILQGIESMYQCALKASPHTNKLKLKLVITKDTVNEGSVDLQAQFILIMNSPTVEAIKNTLEIIGTFTGAGCFVYKHFANKKSQEIDTNGIVLAAIQANREEVAKESINAVKEIALKQLALCEKSLEVTE
jgi:hypothetical protein